MRRSNLGEAVVPTVIVLYIIAYVVQTYDMPFRAILYPFIVLGLLVAFLGIFLFREFVLARPEPEAARADGPGAERPAPPARPAGPFTQRAVAFVRDNPRAFGIIVLTWIYPGVIEHLGFFLTTTLYLSILFRTFDTLRGHYIVPAAAVLSLALNWLLLNVLTLALPSFAYARLPFGL